MKKYDEVVSFIVTNKRNPSKNNPEERGLYLNWIKHNRKIMNSGRMKEERVALFLKLLKLGERYKRVNRWEVIAIEKTA